MENCLAGWQKSVVPFSRFSLLRRSTFLSIFLFITILLCSLHWTKSRCAFHHTKCPHLPLSHQSKLKVWSGSGLHFITINHQQELRLCQITSDYLGSSWPHCLPTVTESKQSDIELHSRPQQVEIVLTCRPVVYVWNKRIYSQNNIRNSFLGTKRDFPGQVEKEIWISW